MGKKSKNKQKQQPLKAVAAPIAPVSAVHAPSPTAAIKAPPAPAMARPTAPASTTSITKEVVSETYPPGTGTVMGRIYSPSGKVLYGRVLEFASGQYYTCHSKASTVPDEGTIVQFETYEFDGRPAAKIIKEVGKNKVVLDRVETLNKLPVYRLMQMQDFLASEGAETENANIIGTTPEGNIVYYEKETRK